VLPISETIDEWAAKDDSGFVEVPGRGWVSVQETAATYAKDKRRNTDLHFEWEASAARFIQAVGPHTRWCLHPDELEVFESARVVTMTEPWPLEWEGKRRRTA
jgi:hypothetical protein